MLRDRRTFCKASWSGCWVGQPMTRPLSSLGLGIIWTKGKDKNEEWELFSEKAKNYVQQQNAQWTWSTCWWAKRPLFCKMLYCSAPLAFANFLAIGKSSCKCSSGISVNFAPWYFGTTKQCFGAIGPISKNANVFSVSYNFFDGIFPAMILQKMLLNRERRFGQFICFEWMNQWIFFTHQSASVAILNNVRVGNVMGYFEKEGGDGWEWNDDVACTRQLRGVMVFKCNKCTIHFSLGQADFSAKVGQANSSLFCVVYIDAPAPRVLVNLEEFERYTIASKKGEEIRRTFYLDTKKHYFFHSLPSTLLLVHSTNSSTQWLREQIIYVLVSAVNSYKGQKSFLNVDVQIVKQF